MAIVLQVILLSLALSQQLPLPGRAQMFPQLPLPLGRFKFLPAFTANPTTPVSLSSRAPSLAETIGRPLVDTSLPANTAADEAIRAHIDACSRVMATAQLGCPCASPGGICADPLSLCDRRNQCICDGRFGYSDATGRRCIAYVVPTTTRKSTSTTSTATTTTTSTTTATITATTRTTSVTTTIMTSTTTSPEKTAILCNSMQRINGGDVPSAFENVAPGESHLLTTTGTEEPLSGGCGVSIVSTTGSVKVQIQHLQTTQTDPNTAVGTCQQAQVYFRTWTILSPGAIDYTFCTGGPGGTGNPPLANMELTFSNAEDDLNFLTVILKDPATPPGSGTPKASYNVRLVVTAVQTATRLTIPAMVADELF